MFFVYVLKNFNDAIYIGQTKNLANRLKRHNTSGSVYMKNRGPFVIIHSEQFATRSEAMKREKQLKSSRGRRWIKESVLK